MFNSSVLFLLKRKHIYGYDQTSKNIESGLNNSANFVNQMLNEHGINSNVVHVIDNNCIDREVTKYKPKLVVIEALWVIPEKFEVLTKLHPDVTWIIRLHSEIPFIANEGSAFYWTFEYSKLSHKHKIIVAPNTIKMYYDLKGVGIKNLIYLPNYYPVKNTPFIGAHNRSHIDIGCFGAIRPMKNQLIQAVAAIHFGDRVNKPIHFHINSERVERGSGVIKNIRGLFENQNKHKLIEHPWLSHDDFIEVIRSMDLGLQVSFNETFNIVAADFAANNIPIVGSEEINWLSSLYTTTSTTSTEDIIRKLELAYKYRKINLQVLNKWGLINKVNIAKSIWINTIKPHN
jgi:hypothetical protein